MIRSPIRLAFCLVTAVVFSLAAQWPASSGVARAEEAAKPNTEEKDSTEYYELLKLFADTLDQVERNYVKDISRRELIEAAIEGMLTKLDQYSDYIPPEEAARFKEDVENEFSGIGVRISIENNTLMVSSPLPGTPAFRAGIIAGDHITHIKDEPTKGLAVSEIVKRIKGRVGTEVKLTIFRPSEASTRTVSIRREKIRVDTVLGDRRGSDNRWNFLYDEKDKIGYLRITGFGRRTAEDVRGALEQLTKQNLRGLVLDLRFNPGGLLSSAIEISDLFVSKGRIVSTSGRNIDPQTWDATSEDTFEGFPMAVLVNRYSASASEIVAACLKDNGRSIVIGKRTWGKGSVQNIVELESGRSALKLTTAGYLRPNGENIHRAKGAKEEDEWGVRPSEGYVVELSGDELSEYILYRHNRDILRPAGESDEEKPDEDGFTDRPLEKALEYIRESLAEASDKPVDDPSPEADAKKSKDAPGDD